jgi:hypothetical protein
VAALARMAHKQKVRGDWNFSPIVGVQYGQVHTMRARWLLPLCNVAMDLFLFGVLVHAVDAYRLTLKSPPRLWRQVHGHGDWLMCFGHTPEPLSAIIAGNVPAALIASLPLANGWQSSSPFDVRLASLYLIVAVLFWYMFGRWAESEHAKVRQVANGYVLLRLVLAPLSMSFSGGTWTMLSHWLLVSVWLVGASFLLLHGGWRLHRRINSRRVRPA